MRILLTGATGYVGGRLLPLLEQQGHAVRCLVRRPERLADRVAPSTELCRGDASDPADLARACEGMEVAYWLVHSMESGVDFERADRLAAERFATAARAAGVRRLVPAPACRHGTRDREHRQAARGCDRRACE